MTSQRPTLRRHPTTLPLAVAAIVASALLASAPAASELAPQATASCDAIAWTGSDGAVDQVYTTAADGTGRTAISPVGTGYDPTRNSRPVWSPDGTRIAWTGSDVNDITQIYVAHADGTNRIKISDDGTGTGPTGNRRPVWSPDGTRIAWTGDDGTTVQIYVARPDGTDRIEISTVDTDPDPTLNLGPV